MNVNQMLYSNRMAGFDALDGAFDLSDITFEQLVSYVQDTYQLMRQCRDKIKAVNAKKKALNDYMNKLSDYLGNSSAKQGDDTIWIPGGLDDPMDPDRIPTAWRTAVENQMAGNDNTFEMNKEMIENSPGFASFLPEYAEKAGAEVTYIPNKENPERIVIKLENYASREAFGLYKQQAVTEQNNIKQRKFDNLNVSSQLLMIDFQRFMNDFNQKLQMTSNIEAKDDRTKNGIIGNIKG